MLDGVNCYEFTHNRPFLNDFSGLVTANYYFRGQFAGTWGFDVVLMPKAGTDCGNFVCRIKWWVGRNDEFVPPGAIIQNVEYFLDVWRCGTGEDVADLIPSLYEPCENTVEWNCCECVRVPEDCPNLPDGEHTVVRSTGFE